MSNHKNTLYLLETNNRHEIESFKIINYFDVNELTFEENKISEGFPKFGKLTISINEAYEVIDVEDKQKGNILQSKRKEYGRNKTSVQKYYLVMEDEEGEQYLYSTKSFNYVINGNDRIELNDATKTKFDLLIQSLESKEDFEKRVDALNKKLGNLKKNTSTLFSSFKKKGGGIEDITIDKSLRQKFMNMIENYITCVNEVLNLPFFKKLFYASTSSPFILSDGEVFNRLKKFHYINLYFKTNNEFIDFEGVDDNFKFLFLGLKPGGFSVNKIKTYLSSDLINEKITDILNHTSIIAKNDKEIKTIIESKYSQSDLTSNYKSIPIYYFANSILQDIRDVAVGENILKYEQFFKEKKYIEFKNRIMEFMYFILEIIETETKYMLELLYNDIENFESGEYDSPVYLSVQDTENMDKINDFVKDKMEVTMLTYLKIRNDQHNEIVVDNLSNENLKLYNARFFLKLHKPEIDADPIKMIEVNYSDDNEKYYEENESEKMKAITLNKKPINLHLYKSFEDDEGSYDINPSTRFSQNKYPRKYLFGEFNNIFKPDLNNSQIAERTEEVINNLLSDRPVFMIGYGASGAGKTSTLIYFNKAKTDGILIELCKIMGSKGYTSLNVKTCELYQDSNIYKKNIEQTGSVETNIQIVKTDEHNFTYEEELGFVSKGEIKHKNHHIYRVFKTNKKNNDLGDDNTCNAETFKVFPNNTNLGEYLIYVIDTDRHVKATTNNINSSRSHSLVFVEMKNDDNKTAHLVVGDFAGVENEFNCDNPQVLDNFMQIKKDDGSLFYKEEVCEDDIDPIGFSVKQKEQIQGGEGEENSSYNINEEYINKFKTIFNEKPYNFENCDIDELNKEENFSDIIFKEDSKADQQTHFRNSVRILRKAANIDLNTKTNQEYNPLSEARFKNIRNLNLTSYRDELNIYNDTIEKMKNLVTSNRDIAKQRTLMAEISSILSNSAEMARSSHGKEKSFRNSQTIINSNGITLENTSLFYKLKFQSKINEFPYSKFGLQQRLFYFIEYYFLRKASSNLKEEIKNVSVINSTITKEDQAFITMNRIAKYYTGKDIPALDYIRDFPLPSDGKITYEIENVPNFIIHFKKALDNKKPKQEDKFESEKTKLFQNISGLKKLPTILKEKSPSNQEIIFNYFEKNSIFSQIDENGGLRTQFQDSINYVKYILDDKYSNFLFNLEAYTYQQQALAISVCDNRKIEGYFINNSLAEIREIIKEIIKRKNDGVNSILPNYLDICFERYCPTHKNCFSFTDKKKNKDSTNEVQSAIFNVIQEYFATKPSYQSDNYKEDTTDDGLNTKLFYQKLVIGIFCVLNISKKANNPPPVPYVDINDLKRIVFNYNLFTDKNKNELKLEFTRLARNLIYSIENKYIDTYKNGNKIEKRNLLQEIKQSKEFNIKDKIKIHKLQEDNTLYTEINLYTFFKYILNILLPSDELIDKEEEIKLKIDSLTDDLENELQKYNLVDQLHQFNNKRITHLQQLKKNIARKYRLKSLTRLVHFLEVDKIRLTNAEESTFSYARDGYNPSKIYDNLNDIEKENFKSGYGITDEDINSFYSLDARNPNQETQRENIYVSIREYIQSNIQKLYSEVFVDNNFLLTEVFDIEQSNLQFGFSGEDSNESITLEALDNINEYISKHISYFRSDAFNTNKMKELLTIIDDFKTAISHLSKIAEKAEKEIKNIEDSLNILPNISDVKETTGVSQEEQFNTKQTDIQNKIDELRKTLIPFQENNENLVKLNKQILNLNRQLKNADSRVKGLKQTEIKRAEKNRVTLSKQIDQEKPEKQKIEQEIKTLQEQLNQNQSGFEKSYGDSEEGKNKQKLNLKQKIGEITENLMKQIDRLKNPLPEDSQLIIKNKNISKKVVNSKADYCMDLLEKFLISIDNNNSASAIGTLEFIDKMAKLNSVANICNFNNETLNQQEFYKEFNIKSGYQLVPLYEEDNED